MSGPLVLELFDETGRFLACDPGDRSVVRYTGREHVGFVYAGATTPWNWSALPGVERWWGPTGRLIQADERPWLRTRYGESADAFLEWHRSFGRMLPSEKWASPEGRR